MQNLFKKFTRSNKGFTLVELIIVVAILAVLSGALVPQYLKYVEDSRKGVDKAYIHNVANAAQVAAASKENIYGTALNITFNTTGEFTVANATGGGATPGTAATALQTELQEVLGSNGANTFKSNWYKDAAHAPSIAISATGVVTTTLNDN